MVLSKVKTRALLFLILVLLVLSPTTFAAGGSTTVRVSGSESLVIGTWDLPWPLDDYRIDISAIPSFEGSNTLSWSINKDLVSPGETLSLTANLEEGMYTVRLTITDNHGARAAFTEIIAVTTSTQTITEKQEKPAQQPQTTAPFPSLPLDALFIGIGIAIAGIAIGIGLHRRASVSKSAT